MTRHESSSISHSNNSSKICELYVKIVFRTLALKEVVFSPTDINVGVWTSATVSGRTELTKAQETRLHSDIFFEDDGLFTIWDISRSQVAQA